MNERSYYRLMDNISLLLHTSGNTYVKSCSEGINKGIYIHIVTVMLHTEAQCDKFAAIERFTLTNDRNEDLCVPMAWALHC